MHEPLSRILSPYRGQRGTLAPVLQKVREKLGYLSGEAVLEIACFLGLYLGVNSIMLPASIYGFTLSRPAGFGSGSV